MLYKDHGRKGSLAESKYLVVSQGAWRQEELIGSKPPSQVTLTLTLTLKM
jgi:hypothetical protein